MAGPYLLSLAAVDVLSQTLDVDTRLFPFEIPSFGRLQADRARIARAVFTDLARRDLIANGEIEPDLRRALHTVADALTAHGFAAHAERHGDGLRIVSDHCPFGGAAIEHPVICAVDRGLVRGMLGALYGQADAATSESRAMGDSKCITSITS